MDNNNNAPANFDATEIYTKEIEPLANKLRELCKQHKIPVLISICIETAPTEKGSRHKMTNLVYPEASDAPDEFARAPDRQIAACMILNGEHNPAEILAYAMSPSMFGEGIREIQRENAKRTAH